MTSFNPTPPFSPGDRVVLSGIYKEPATVMFCSYDHQYRRGMSGGWMVAVDVSEWGIRGADVFIVGLRRVKPVRPA